MEDDFFSMVVAFLVVAVIDMAAVMGVVAVMGEVVVIGEVVAMFEFKTFQFQKFIVLSGNKYPSMKFQDQK